MQIQVNYPIGFHSCSSLSFGSSKKKSLLGIARCHVLVHVHVPDQTGSTYDYEHGSVATSKRRRRRPRPPAPLPRPEEGAYESGAATPKARPPTHPSSARARLARRRRPLVGRARTSRAPPRQQCACGRGGTPPRPRATGSCTTASRGRRPRRALRTSSSRHSAAARRGAPPLALADGAPSAREPTVPVAFLLMPRGPPARCGGRSNVFDSQVATYATASRAAQRRTG